MPATTASLAHRDIALVVPYHLSTKLLIKRKDKTMKGMVFTEFLDMVETKFSAAMVDDIIEDSQVASGGAYTVRAD